MSTIKLFYQSGGEIQGLETNLQSTLSELEEDEIQEMGIPQNFSHRLDQAQELIRNCTEYTLESFKNFGGGKIEEVTLKFGIQLGGKAGIPYITEGNAQGNIEIEIKCKF